VSEQWPPKEHLDAVNAKYQQPPLTLPDPDGRDSYGPGAWWLLSSGAHVFAQVGAVYGLLNNDPRCLDSIEQDALAALAAVRWARQTESQLTVPNTPRTPQPSNSSCMRSERDGDQ